MIFFSCGGCRYPLAIPFQCRRCHPRIDIQDVYDDTIVESKLSLEELVFNLHDATNLLEFFIRIPHLTDHTLNQLALRLTTGAHLVERRQCNLHPNEVGYVIPYGSNVRIMHCHSCPGTTSRDFVETYPQGIPDEIVYEITKRVMCVHTRYNESAFGYVSRSIVKHSNIEMFKIMIASGCKAEVSLAHTIDIDSHRNGGCLEVMLAIGITTLTDNLLSRRALELCLVSSDLDAQVQLMLAYNLHPTGVHSLLMSFNNMHPFSDHYNVFNHMTPKTISFLKRDDILPLQHLAMVAYRKNEILRSIDSLRNQINSYN